MGKFELTFVFCEFVVTTTIFLEKLVVNRTTATNFFPPNVVALLCPVTGTKVQMVDFVVVVLVVVVVGSKSLYCDLGTYLRTIGMASAHGSVTGSRETRSLPV